jgi:hypothetical protein
MRLAMAARMSGGIIGWHWLIKCADFDARDCELISKRLHISGLTPAISFDDLSRRLGSFGSVTALDGLGKLDAVGQPRKFAYATLQTTKPQLSRCTLFTLSLSLSGFLTIVTLLQA